MKRIGLVVAYDGTNYCGWQTQPNGITVQGVLNETLSELLGEKIETIGASRTDAGVHAMGNVAVFDTNTRIPGEKISYALNQRLPEDIRIQLSEEVEPDFHPRYCDSEIFGSRHSSREDKHVGICEVCFCECCISEHGDTVRCLDLFGFFD